MPPVSVLVTSGLFRAKQELPTTVFSPTLSPPRADDEPHLPPFFIRRVLLGESCLDETFRLAQIEFLRHVRIY